MQVPYHYIGLNIHKRTIAFCEKRVDGQTVGAGAFGATAFYNHVPGGSNVLYLDGHVEFVRFGDKPPVTNRATGHALELVGQFGMWMFLVGGYG